VVGVVAVDAAPTRAQYTRAPAIIQVKTSRQDSHPIWPD
jgi:hypothetical protein